MIQHRQGRGRGKPLILNVEASLDVKLAPSFVPVVYEAVKPEVLGAPSSYVKARLMKHDGGLILELQGREIPHMRAAINSYTRLITSAEQTLRSVRG